MKKDSFGERSWLDDTRFIDTRFIEGTRQQRYQEEEFNMFVLLFWSFWNGLKENCFIMVGLPASFVLAKKHHGRSKVLRRNLTWYNMALHLFSPLRPPSVVCCLPCDTP